MQGCRDGGVGQYDILRMRGWNPALGSIFSTCGIMVATFFHHSVVQHARGLCLQSGISPAGYWQAAGSSLRRQAFRLPVLPYFLLGMRSSGSTSISATTLPGLGIVVVQVADNTHAEAVGKDRAGFCQPIDILEFHVEIAGGLEHIYPFQVVDAVYQYAKCSYACYSYSNFFCNILHDVSFVIYFCSFLNSLMAVLTFIFSPFLNAMMNASLNLSVMLRLLRSTLL